MQGSVARSMGVISKGAYKRTSAASAAGMRASGAVAGYNAMVISAEAPNTAATGMVTGDLSGWDFVPYVASARALASVWRKCR